MRACRSSRTSLGKWVRIHASSDVSGCAAKQKGKEEADDAEALITRVATDGSEKTPAGGTGLAEEIDDAELAIKIP